MKKVLLVLLIFSVFLTGCNILLSGQALIAPPSSGDGVVPTGATVEEEHPSVEIPDPSNDCGPLCKEGDVENNINSGDLPGDGETPDINNGIDKPTEEDSGDTTNTDGTENDSNRIKSFNTVIPADLKVDLKYTRYQVENDYLIVISQGANIRQEPDSSSPVIKSAQQLERFKLIAEEKGEMLAKYGSDRWYKISLEVNSKTVYGYIFSALAEPRQFQFEKMLEAVSKLRDEIGSNTSGYVVNYKDRNGQAPAYKGKSEDAYGIERYQSAPAYLQASTTSDFRYMSDGTLVSILAETDSFYRVRTLTFEGEYYIPKKYISFGQAPKELTKAVVVDRKNQNEGVFEFSEGEWKLISYIYATTGETAKYKQPTELGYFMAIQKMSKFRYLDDVTKKIAGYAPHAIRFNGGAYIHGVPVDYKVQDNTLIDPGMQEFLYSIGTIPRSHKCVRNYTSHALFLYNWVEIGKSAVIVIE